MLKKNDISYENTALAILVFSVSFTIFAPAVHYIGYSLVLLMLIYGKMKYKAPLFCFPDKTCRNVSLVLLLFFLWSAFVNLVYMSDFRLWGKGASVYLEMLIGYLLAVRLLCTERSRKVFISFFIPATVIIFIMIIVKNQFLLLILPKRMTMNGNTLGLYAVMAFPYVFFYSMWFLKDKIFLKYASCIIVLLVAFISFSSGAWLSIAFMLLFFLYFAAVNKKINIKSVIIAMVLCITMSVGLDCMSHGSVFDRFKLEKNQISAIDNMDSLTNHRYAIWRIVSGLVLKNPIAGYGRESLEQEYAMALPQYPDIVRDNNVVHGHAHNMYIELAFSGGLPAMILFMTAFIILFISTWRGRNVVEEGIPWNLILSVLLAGQLVYCLTGDVFEARRDIAVIFWTSLGIASVLPKSALKCGKRI
ncbi:O-antigen ligase family protein [Cloacibacillus evryensis]|uniref:O-antigen ligase family protein n=1 Tax=Cloacibacillus evryensis TaxID=508460 RepID=UPI00241C4397|nr:O-antigen ligase family protein [Cloacibacillus evryensis]